jgi:Paraquat-inducible protein A
MGRLIAAVLVVASGIFLYFALTLPVVTSRLKDLHEIIRVVYPMQAFIESKQPPKPAAAVPGQPPPAPAPAAAPPAPIDISPEAYDKSVSNLEGLVKAMVLKTDSAKQNYADLTKEKGYTAWQSAKVLWDVGDKVSATAIVAFSVAYPVLKTLALLVLIVLNVTPKNALKLAEFTHKYTMLDVFVAAITVVSASSQQLLVIHTGPAILFYIAYLVTGFAGVSTLIFHRKRPAETPAASA